MENKILIAGVLVIAFAFATGIYAVGQNSGVATSNQIQQQTRTINEGEDSQIQLQNNEQVQSENAAGISAEAKNQQVQLQSQDGEEASNQVKEQNQEQKNEQKGKINAEQHKSAVSAFVQNLLRVADKEGSIGEQVRTIAQQQNQSADTTIQAMEKVQTRSELKTFLIGSDYKNLGTLRSEMVQTRNRLEQLNKLMEKVQNESDKTELQNQTQTLEQEQAKIESFIKDNANRFSLFGWFVKLFNR